MRLRSFALAGLLASSASAFASESDVINAAASARSTEANWDAAVRAAMLATYDADGSGMIEKSSELKAISCTVWTALNQAVEAGWEGVGMRVIYGFKKGSIWVAYAWGIDQKLSKKADKAAAACGVP
jgi:hypothetical protein